MKKKRVQEGIIHVYVRGNGRYRVFYDDIDHIMFLKKCNFYAKKHGVKIMEFALMVNHAHLLIETTCVSKFMREFLQSYSCWYNAKRASSNKVFKSPFSSALKSSEGWVLQNSMYILQNPVSAKLSDSVETYMWNSEQFHFIEKRKNVSALEKYISVDTSLIDSYFGSYEEFNEFSNRYMQKVQDLKLNNDYWEKTSPDQLSKIMADFIHPKRLEELTLAERDELIVYLKENTKSSYVSIASLLHESYDYVRRVSRYDF